MSLIRVDNIESLSGATGSIIITGNIIANGVPIAGVTGATGQSGTSGSSGSSGTSGINGTSGIDGTSGVVGPTGDAGTSGTSGVDGATGEAGTSGINGATGDAGTSGIDGTSGINGATGDSGTSGTSGIDGTTGSTGPTGEAGTSGTSGVDGTSGSVGPTGDAGTSGTSGIDGTSGSTGPTGPTNLSPSPTTFTSLGNGYSYEVGNTGWVQIPIGTRFFTKVYDETQIDIFFNSRISVSTMSSPGGGQGMTFQVWVGGTSANAYISPYVIMNSDPTSPEPLPWGIMRSIYTGLPSGSHSVTVVARTNSGTGGPVIIDPGGFGGTIIVTEHF